MQIDATPAGFPWVRVRVRDDAAVYTCERCGASRTLTEIATSPDFRREAHDFLLRHKNCTEARA